MGQCPEHDGEGERRVANASGSREAANTNHFAVTGMV